MKTKLFLIGAFAFLSANTILAQDVTTVNAKSSDISDNLDLRAVASIFGESANLEDFERRLNDPKEQISNLDLNNDGNVDYLRVIESVEGNTHVIIIQSVLEKDVYQDVATVEVEKDSNNQVQVQVVGDVYMYGPNYIYEPVYVSQPVIYNSFWVGSYNPYYSPYYYNYYPSYYYTWNPYPVYRYRRNVNVYINVNNHYNYVTTRRSQRAVAIYSGRRANGYEVRNPNRSFAQRNNNITNRHELDVKRGSVTGGGRNSGRNNTINGTRPLDNSKGTFPSRGNNSKPGSGGTGTVRNNDKTSVRNNGAVRTNISTINNTPVKSNGTFSTRNNDSGTRKSTTFTPAQSNNISTPVRNTTSEPVRSQSSPSVSQPVRQYTPSTPAPVRAQSQPAPVRSEPAPVRAQPAPVQSQPRSVAPAARPAQNNGSGRSEGSRR